MVSEIELINLIKEKVKAKSPQVYQDKEKITVEQSGIKVSINSIASNGVFERSIR